MKSKHEIPNKFDYMKAFSFNLILTERTNSELENERNVGKIDGAFYRNFSWQIMGKKKERQLSSSEIKVKKQEVQHTESTEATPVRNGEVLEVSHSDTVDGEKLVQSRTDFTGSAPKRYTTTCYLKPRTIPAWYTESLVIYVGSTKRRYNERVWLKNTLHPYYWSENMTTEVNMPPTKTYVSEVVIPTENSDIHYMSLEPQQTVTFTKLI